MLFTGNPTFVTFIFINKMLLSLLLLLTCTHVYSTKQTVITIHTFFTAVLVLHLMSCENFNLLVLCFKCVNKGNFINLERAQSEYTGIYKGTVKSAYKQSGPSGRHSTPVSVARSGKEYCYSPPGWDASPSQGYPPCEARQCGIKFLV